MMADRLSRAQYHISELRQLTWDRLQAILADIHSACFSAGEKECASDVGSESDATAPPEGFEVGKHDDDIDILVCLASPSRTNRFNTLR